MARKPPAAYASLELPATENPVPASAPVIDGATQDAPPAIRGLRRKRAGGTTLKEKAHHVMIYPSEESWKAIKRYSLEADCKPHDVYIEAIQDWLDRHGIDVTARVPSRDRDIED